MKGYYKDEHRYDDIINLPHHQSKTRPHMQQSDRAAQFSPFAPTLRRGRGSERGYDDIEEEAEREGENQPEGVKWDNA